MLETDHYRNTPEMMLRHLSLRSQITQLVIYLYSDSGNSCLQSLLQQLDLVLQYHGMVQPHALVRQMFFHQQLYLQYE